MSVAETIQCSEATAVYRGDDWQPALDGRRRSRAGSSGVSPGLQVLGDCGDRCHPELVPPAGQVGAQLPEGVLRIGEMIGCPGSIWSAKRLVQPHRAANV